ncbi:MAG: DUF998 domain-containing protein [Thermoplasmata archaeon]
MSASIRERRGPLLPRAARRGAALLLAGSLQFIVVGMLIPELRYPGYSPIADTISALGNTAHSPLAWLFNASIVVLGLLSVVSFALLWSAFHPGARRLVALGLLSIASLGAIGVGVAPENLQGTIHSLAALLVFLAGGLGLLLLPLAMTRDTRWDGFRLYTALSGLVTLIALLLYLRHLVGPLGTGGLERLIVAPLLLWEILVGVRLLGLPAYAPPARPVAV